MPPPVLALQSKLSFDLHWVNHTRPHIGLVAPWRYLITLPGKCEKFPRCSLIPLFFSPSHFFLVQPREMCECVCDHMPFRCCCSSNKECERPSSRWKQPSSPPPLHAAQNKEPLAGRTKTIPEQKCCANNNVGVCMMRKPQITWRTRKDPGCICSAFAFLRRGFKFCCIHCERLAIQTAGAS